jgi:hypothetical protein
MMMSIVIAKLSGTHFQEVRADQVAYIVDVGHERICMRGLALMLGHRLISSLGNAFLYRQFVRYILSRDPEVNDVVLRWLLRPGVVEGLAGKVPFTIWLIWMPHVGIHSRRIHHDVVTVPVSVGHYIVENREEWRRYWPVSNPMFMEELHALDVMSVNMAVKYMWSNLEYLSEEVDRFANCIEGRAVQGPKQGHDDEHDIVLTRRVENVKDRHSMVAGIGA